MKATRLSTNPPPPPIQEVPTPNMNVACPHCQVRLSVHPSQAGSVITCPKCGGKFQAPLPTAQLAGGPYRGMYTEPTDVQLFANKKIASGICGLLLGALGIHKFILGFNKSGIIMLIVTIVGLPFAALPTLAMMIIGLIEGIIYLTKSDEDFYQTYAIQKKEWF